MSPTEKQGIFGKISATIIGPKREWYAYKRRVKALPAPYAEAVEGIQRYVFHFGAINGAGAMSLFDDVINLFEQAAADGTPVRAIVGEDPVEFVDALIRNYDNEDGYVAREKNRLRAAMDKAVEDEARGDHE
jgi:DNA-binding ferritin-like protein (Dps family)